MLFDYRQNTGPDDFDAHLCIVGAGPAGIILAHQFLGSSLRICLLEGGGLAGDPQVQALYAGASVGQPELDPARCRLRAFGGSTNVWGGGCMPLSRMDLDARDWVPGSGWPIDYAELHPYYQRARDLLDIGQHEFDDRGFHTPAARTPLQFDQERLVNRNFVLSPVFFGHRYRRELEQSSNVQLVLNANLLELQASPQGDVVQQARIGSLDGRRGLVHARQFVLAAGGIENARLLLLSDSVQRNGLGNEHGLVGRYFMDHPRGRLGTLHADSTTRVTRPYDRTGGKGPAPAFPELCLADAAMRRHGLLSGRVRPVAVEGEAPPGIRAMRKLRSRIRRTQPDEGQSLEGQMSASLSLYPEQPQSTGSEEGVARLALQMAPGIGDIARGMFNKIAQKPVVKADHVDVIGYFEQAPNPDSRVQLGQDTDALGLRQVNVDWRLTDLDWHTYRTAAGLFGDELARACGGRFQMDEWLQEQGAAPALQGTAHHMGTTRMSDDPRSGVVDRNGRVHGVDNLHVVGSSVFPTGGWAFPTFTIAALSMRLADHLRDFMFLL